MYAVLLEVGFVYVCCLVRGRICVRMRFCQRSNLCMYAVLLEVGFVYVCCLVRGRICVCMLSC
jgi:hypothetical protein